MARGMDLRRLIFDLGAPIYDRLTGPPAWHIHARRLSAWFPAQAGPRTILDIGCGTGVSALAFKDAAPGDRVLGVDISAPMVRLARRNDPRGTCLFVVGDGCRLPLPDAAVDAVAGHSFLYLVPDRAAALREIRRVLRPGGRLVLLEPHRQGWARDLASVARVALQDGPRFAITMAAWRIVAAASGGFPPGALEALLREHGFASPTTEPTLHGLGWIASAEGVAAGSAPHRE